MSISIILPREESWGFTAKWDISGEPGYQYPTNDNDDKFDNQYNR